MADRDDFFTPDRLVWLYSLDYAVFPGFSGETCFRCRKTSNAMYVGPGWFCECGTFNRFKSGQNLAHECPDLGPMRDKLRQAFYAAGRTLDGNEEAKVKK